jgi:ribosomal protein S18 acetylase RimI-like enzyme
LQLRRATGSDADEVAAVYVRSRQQAAPYIPGMAHTLADVRDWFASIVLVEHEVWVAVIAGRIVGLTVLRGNSLDQLYVLPEHQGRGVGSRLLDQVKRARGTLRLHAFQSNEPAREFYEKRGFRAIAFGDGTGNEDGAPDVLYEWKKGGK